MSPEPSGQASIWEMNGTKVIDEANVGTNPGPSWKAIGTGDFNGDGHSDILWQNTSGQASIWEMNGTKVIDEANVGANPGASWHAIKTRKDAVSERRCCSDRRARAQTCLCLPKASDIYIYISCNHRDDAHCLIRLLRSTDFPCVG
jgi:hypothetical protein